MSEEGSWPRVKAILADALDLPPREREAFLDSACGGNGALRESVAGLLEVEPRAAGFLERTPPVRSPAPIGFELPGFRVRRILGAGGMGVVFEAEQERPRRIVALKTVFPGGATADALRRFEREAEILARLQHPAIAAIHAAGSIETESGAMMPYFAMEVVDSPRTIVDHANENRLSVRERLELFARACDAVHHAHQRGVIHRDLKPGNVLVSAAGALKVIDFGVALVAGAAATRRTRAGELLGTLAYMSPEQAAGDPDAADVRADVYSLGALLRELLWGRPARRLGRRSRAVRGRPADLVSIVAKATDDIRGSRYASASALADDVRRFLRHEPIEARPPSLARRFRLYVRRHRAFVAVTSGAAAVALASAAAITVVSIRSARRESAERAAADGIRWFLGSMIRTANPERSLGSDVSLREMLDAAAARVDLDVEFLPESRRVIHESIAETYCGLGDFSAMARHYRRAMEIALETEGPGYRGESAHRLDLATALSELGEVEEAERTLRDVLARERSVPTIPREAAANGRYVLGRIRAAKGDLVEAENLASEALDAYRAALGPEHRNVAMALDLMGSLASARRDLVDAERLYREAMEMNQRLGDDLGVARGWNNVANVLSSAGRFGEAEVHYRESLAIHARVCGADHPLTAQSRLNLAALLRRRSRASEAIPLLEGALPVLRRSFGDSHATTLLCANSLAAGLMEAGRFVDAGRCFDEWIEIVGPEDSARWALETLRGECLARLGRYDESEAALLRCDARYRASPETWPLAGVVPAAGLATLYRATGRAAEAGALEAGIAPRATPAGR